MKQVLLITFIAAIAGMNSLAQAGYSGDISFSSEEVQRHQDGLPVLMKVAAQCLQNDLDYHRSFFKQYGISPFYGDRSSFGKLSYEGKREALRQMGKNPALLGKMSPTSCIGLALKCLGKGFDAADQSDIWARLRAYTIRNDVSGGALQLGLQQLGWRVLYWNPDTRKNYTWDNMEREKSPTNPKYIWGFHASNWAEVKRSRKYLYNTVDDISSLVNFGNVIPPAIRDVPFFVGIAHGGYHVFPGSYGQIIEGHSTRQLSDKLTLETSPFNPLINGGGPHGDYRSGLVAVPPGYIDSPVANRFPEGYSPGRMDSGHTAPMVAEDSYGSGSDDYYYSAPRRTRRNEYRGPFFPFW